MSFKDLVEKRNRDREAEHERREPVSDVAHVEVTAEAERGDILLADVEKFIGRFGVHPSEHARVAHVLWVGHRDADVWEALIAVADAAGGDWPKRAREAAKALIKEAHDVEPSLGIRLLADLKTVFGDVEQMTTEAILRALCAMPEAPWNDLRGKPLNERGLAQRLRPYGVKPKVIRVGEATPRGYTRESLHDPWLAYLPPSPPDGSATSATSETDDEKLNLFSGKAVADDRRGERNSPATSATRAADVADSVAHVADDVADKGEKNISKSNGVADVADVVHLPAADDLSIPACLDRRAEANRVCAHCGQPGGLPVAYGEALATVHPDCRDAWLRTQFSRTTAAGSSQ